MTANSSKYDRFEALASTYTALTRFLRRSGGPLADLLLRLWLAQGFFVSAILKLSNWDNAVLLAENEYPVSWLAPENAAVLGVLAESAGAVLLGAGLATRAAALALAALALVIHANYAALDHNLLQIALFVWYIARGADRLSLDALLAPGLADSALPFAAPISRALARFTRAADPAYRALLRLWLAGALLAAATITAATPALPLESAAGFTAAPELVLAALLAIGFGARIAALGLVAFAAASVRADGDAFYWLALFALFALYGPGRVSFDALVVQSLRRRFPQLAGMPAFELQRVPQVVIVGAGFGGLTCAAVLARERVSVTLVDRQNYHLFQPLLYQVATAALAPGDIAVPVRGLFREHFNVRVLLGEVSGVDTANQMVSVGAQRLPYDYLVLATGAAHSYFGRDDWAPFAPGLKRVEDATEVRRRLLSAFERAEATDDPEERAALLTFLIVGGGPTGVELAGAIAELARFGMQKEFRRFDPGSARILLVQAAPRLLPSFPETLSEQTRRSLETLGVEVLLGSRVEAIDATGVSVNGGRIAARNVLWAAGVIASPAAKWLGAPADNAGRIAVGPDLSVPGLPNVFAIGDTALSQAWGGNPVPGLAPAAKQGGYYVARVIRARLRDRRAPAPFRYLHLGSLATIGRKAAVADFGFLRMTGAPAWWLWGAIHLGFLVGARNRLSVMLDWFWAYLTQRSGTRLITGAGEPSAPAAGPAPPRAPVTATRRLDPVT
jgi:NADH dehydrogenase/putative oxidoreductase